MLYASIIIPTLNRCEVLKNAVSSLLRQTWPTDQHEVIVVDNGSVDRTRHYVEELAKETKVPVRLIYEPRIGLHNARNAGSRAARGEVLIFTDDDATFDPDWVQAYVEAFSMYPTMMAAGGPVRPFWEAPPPRWLLD